MLFVLLISVPLVFAGCDMLGPDFLEDSPSEVEEESVEVEMEAFDQVEVEENMYNVLVGFTHSPGEAEKDLVRNMNGEVERSFNIVDAMEITISKEAISALENQEIVKYVEPNAKVEAHQTVPWGIDRVFGDEEYKFETWDDTRGTGVGVAILDTGIDDEHEDLPEPEDGTNTIDDTHWGDDGSGHGTHVAGTVAALDNDKGVVGVGPEIDLYAVKVLDDDGSGTWSSVAAGIEWAVEEEIPILNMSLGGDESETLGDAVQEANYKGHLIVASAGNDGNPPGNGENVGYPAAYEEVIAVAASDENDNRASFSSTGPEVELIAPGVDVLSTIPDDDYEEYDGTSMSAPHVAGSAALVWDAKEAQLGDNEDIRGILQDTAEDLDMDEEHQGYGLVRPDKAIDVDEEEEEYGVNVIAPEDAEETETGEYTYTYEVENTGTKDDTYDLNAESIDENFVANVQDELFVNADESKNVEVEVEITDDAEAGDSAEITLTAENVEEDVSDSDSMVVTLIGEPEVETVGTSDVSDTSAVLEGELTDLGGADSAEVWFKWADNSDFTDAEETETQTLEEAETFEDTIDGLDPKTEYYFKALAKNDAGDDEGDVEDFTTEEEEEEEELSEPVIEKFEVKTRTTGPWNRADVEWEVSHEDGALEEVKSELLDGNDVVDTEITSVSGEDAFGEHNLRIRNDDADAVRLTVTDTEDQETYETKDIEF